MISLSELFIKIFTLFFKHSSVKKLYKFSDDEIVYLVFACSIDNLE